MESELEKYLCGHCTFECEALDWLERQTNIRTHYPRMLTGRTQGAFLYMIARMLAPRNVLEIGTFTGYSAICMALGLPEGGHIDTLEINDELEDLIREGFGRAGVHDRIMLHIGDAIAFMRKRLEEAGGKAEVLRDMAAEAGNTAVSWGKAAGGGTAVPGRKAEDEMPEANPGKSPEGRLYDLVFIDANKREYADYYELALRLLRPGGFILADDVLWDGKVCAEHVPADRQTAGIARFNDLTAKDPRVETVILPVRHGLGIIRKR